MLNQVVLIGNLGKDAETKFLPSGTSVTNFSIATTRNVKNQKTEEWEKETTWHNIVAWKKENLANYLLKGQLVAVTGRIQNRSYEDKDKQKRYVSEVVADDIRLLGKKPDDGDGDARPDSQQAARPNGGPAARPAASRTTQAPPPAKYDDWSADGITDDDIPF